MPTTAAAPTKREVAHPVTDVDLLQGAWTTVAGPKEARLLIAGTRFAFEFLAGDIYMGSLTLDPGSSPKRMDMRIDVGPGSTEGQHTLCIYRLEGDVLQWCPSRPGRGTYPGEFASVDDATKLSLVFTRDRAKRHR